MSKWDSMNLEAPHTQRWMGEVQAVAQGWQPIETAPKDGTAVLLMAGAKDWLDNEVPSIGWWSTHCGWVGHFASGDIPTHWMPLPEPPK